MSPSCEHACPYEGSSQHQASPGPVKDPELVCRGAYGPTMHFNRSGKIRNALIKNDDLENGILSMWRDFNSSSLGRSELADRLRAEAPGGQELWEIRAAKAGEIRAIKLPGDDLRILCILDECQTDDEGNAHPAHVHVSLCRQRSKYNRDDPEFQHVHTALMNLFTADSAAVWKADGRSR